MIRFFRAHGLLNDYLVVDFSETRATLTPNSIRLLCHRHAGPGGDGLLLPIPSARADFGVRIFNPDGSEAEKSGNGLRIFARYLFDAGRLSTSCSIETAGGIVLAHAHPLPSGKVEFSVDMGRATFATRDIPVNLPGPEAVELELVVGEHRLRGTAVSVGNPHWVAFVDSLEAISLARLGPLIEHHPWFPRRTNVQLARVSTPNTVHVRIWERGAGETAASGSSACAVVAAGLRTGRLGPDVTVHMQGGPLQVRIGPDGIITQRGPVEVIATGRISDELEARLVDMSPPDASGATPAQQ